MTTLTRLFCGALVLCTATVSAAQTLNSVPELITDRPDFTESSEVVGHRVVQIETGLTLAPQSPGLHFTLARAYQRAGRMDDAARERAEFTRLDRLARTEKSGAQSVGGK